MNAVCSMAGLALIPPTPFSLGERGEQEEHPSGSPLPEGERLGVRAVCSLLGIL